MPIRKIVSRSIGTDVITAEDLANNSITVAEITDGAVTDTKIAADAVTENKILDGSVTESKLGTDVQGRMDQAESAMGFKNRIIGGNFTTNPWQRGTSFTSHTSGYTADRFAYSQGGTSAIVNIAKTADAPTIAESGIFTQHCLQLEVTTPDTTIGSAEYSTISQAIEGYNVLDLGFGQSGTRYFTLSFWHKHKKSGTYCVSIQNSAGNRSYIAEYNQSLSDTWEKAEITIPVDTSGTWNYTNGVGLYLWFMLLAGSNYQTTAGSWQSGNYLGTSNQVNNLDSTSNNFKIALVQLEAGQTATAFENRSVGQELSLCQRYYQSPYSVSCHVDTGMSTARSWTANGWDFKVKMRATPTITVYSGEGVTGSSGYLKTYSGQVTKAVTSVGGTSSDNGGTYVQHSGAILSNNEMLVGSITVHAEL